MKLLLKISIIIFIFVLGIDTKAQVPTSMDGVNILTSVSNPKPGQNVNIYLESYTFDLNASSVVWIVDGKTQSQGIGMKNIDITAPQIGVEMNILAIIKVPSGPEIRKNLTIKTGYVDIIWESNGYTPPFFKGKIPFVYQNSVKLIAIPHLSDGSTREIDPKNLVYIWKVGGKFVENGQGYGKQTVVIDSDIIPKDLNVTVEVSNREQTQFTKGSINLTPTEPSLSFYEDDSLYGILFNKELGNEVRLKNTEMKILAIPFGFNLDNRENTYSWSINNIEQPDLISNRSITIRTKGDMDGSSNINLDIRNQDDILQGARASFTVFFNKKVNEENVTF